MSSEQAASAGEPACLSDPHRPAYPIRILCRHFQHSRGAWVVICYSQSFTSQPTRPLLRLTDKSGRAIERILPAAVFGRSQWVGFVPAEFCELELFIYEAGSEHFRIDALEVLGPIALQRRLGKSGLASILRFWGYHWWRSLIQRRQSILAVPERYRLSKIAKYIARRTRAIELGGFDDPGLGDAEDPVTEFLLAISDRSGRTKLRSTLASFDAQAVGGWRLTIAVPPGMREQVASEIVPAHARNSTVRVVEFPDDELRGDIALAKLVEQASAPMIGFLVAGDRLAPEAMLAIRSCLKPFEKVGLAYTDSVATDERGRPAAPRLTPDWSPSYLRHDDYVGGLWLLDAGLAKTASAKIALSGELRRRLPIVAAELAGPARILHIKRLLLQAAPHPTRKRTEAAVPKLALIPQPTVSIVVPTRDRVELLKHALDTLRERTAYANYEIIVVDNGSTDPSTLAYLDKMRTERTARVVADRGDFNFPRLVNSAVRAARGEIIVLLNNDTSVMTPSWLVELVHLANQPGVGAVGAKLLYPGGTIQHAGVVLGLHGYAGHYFRRLPGDHIDHLGRLGFTHEVSAITAACLAVTRANWDAVGGFDEAFAADFNDVDFCLRLRKLGLRNLWTPHALLGHAESASRLSAKGSKSPQFRAEAARFAQRWRGDTVNDPYFHPAFALYVSGEMLE